MPTYLKGARSLAPLGRGRRAKRAFAAASLWLSAGCAHHDTPSATPPEASSAAPKGAAASADAGDAPGNTALKKEYVDEVLNPNKLPVYDGPTGSVEGTITVIGPAAPDVKVSNAHCPAAIDTFGKLFREGTPAEPNGPRPLADAVVAVVGYGGYYVPEKRPAETITIAPDCSYPTRSIAMTFGQRLEVTNLSKYPFAPVLDVEPSPAVMMAPPLAAGDPVRIYPHKPGHALMGDLMQTYVREDVYVLRFPFHAISGRDGHYRIDGIPVGKMSVGAQHPTVLSEAQAPVEIVPNVVQKVDLTLEYAPKAPAAKDKRDNILR